MSWEAFFQYYFKCSFLAPVTLTMWCDMKNLPEETTPKRAQLSVADISLNVKKQK